MLVRKLHPDPSHSSRDIGDESWTHFAAPPGHQSTILDAFFTGRPSRRFAKTVKIWRRSTMSFSRYLNQTGCEKCCIERGCRDGQVRNWAWPLGPIRLLVNQWEFNASYGNADNGFSWLKSWPSFLRLAGVALVVESRCWYRIKGLFKLYNNGLSCVSSIYYRFYANEQNALPAPSILVKLLIASDHFIRFSQVVLVLQGRHWYQMKGLFKVYNNRLPSVSSICTPFNTD